MEWGVLECHYIAQSCGVGLGSSQDKLVNGNDAKQKKKNKKKRTFGRNSRV